jgi:hypothetical protein
MHAKPYRHRDGFVGQDHAEIQIAMEPAIPLAPEPNILTRPRWLQSAKQLVIGTTYWFCVICPKYALIRT